MRESDSEMTEQEVRWDVAVQLDGGTFPCTPALSVERSLWKNGLGNAEWLEPIWNLDRSPIVDLEVGIPSSVCGQDLRYLCRHLCHVFSFLLGSFDFSSSCALLCQYAAQTGLLKALCFNLWWCAPHRAFIKVTMQTH